MKLATLKTASGTNAARIDGSDAVLVPGAANLNVLLDDPEWRARAAAADGDRVALADWESHFACLTPSPRKVVCVGLNYRTHIKEMGREIPEYPTLFAKFADALIGPYDPVPFSGDSKQVDWEAELGIIIGRRAEHVTEAEAPACIAGYTVVNDITQRDWQYRTTQWFQGKAWTGCTPIGPVMVTPDEFDPGQADITCAVNGVEVQSAHISDLVFAPAALVSYISTFTTLSPGDVIPTGTTGGVGHARKPPQYLAPGDVVTTSITGIGVITNRITAQGKP